MTSDKEVTKCRERLNELLQRGYEIMGNYKRNAKYIYLIRNKDEAARPFCLNDDTFSKMKRKCDEK